MLQAKADTVTFNGSGFWTDPFHDIIPLVASVSVDTTLGTISSAFFQMNSAGFGNKAFTTIISQGLDPTSPSYDLLLQTTVFNAGFNPPAPCTPTNGCHDSLSLVLSESPSMAVNDLTWLIVSGGAGLRDAGFGVMLAPGTVLSAATPLPSTFPLLASVLTVLGLVGWFRRQAHWANQ
jgi:hypothetical protein